MAGRPLEQIPDPIRELVSSPLVPGERAVIVGEPGSGKSHWIARVSDAQPAGVCVLSFGGSGAVVTAFGSLRAVRSCPPRLMSLLRSDRLASSDEALYTAERLVDHLRTQPAVVIAVDELAALDAASAHLIRRLLGSEDGPWALVAATDTSVGTYDFDLGARTMELAPIGSEMLLSLVDDRLGAAAAQAIAATIDGAAGNPALALLKAAHASSAQAAEQPIDLGRIPHLWRISPESRELLRTAALLGPDFAVTSLAAARQEPVSALIASLDELSAVRLLEPLGERMTFRHPWVHEAAYASFPAPVRRAMHRELADLMAETSDVDAFDVARQISLSPAPRGSDIELLRQAAKLALGRSPSEGAALLGRAIEIAGPTHPEVSRIEVERVSALLAAGRAREAGSLALEMLARGTVSGLEASLREALSQALLFEDDLTGSVTQLDVALDAALGKVEVNRLIAERSLRRVLGGELDLARAEAESAVRTAIALGDDLARSVASSTLAHVDYYSGDVHAAVELARVAVAAADAAASDSAGRRSRYELGMFLLHADRLDEASLVFEGELRRAASLGPVWYRPLDHYGLAFCHLYASRLDEAEREFRTGLDLVTTTETRWESASARAHLAFIAVMRGDWRRAEELVPADRLTPGRVPHESRDATLWARGQLLEARGDDEAALGAYLASADSAMLSGAPVRLRWIAPDLARAAARAGAPGSAEAATQALEKIAERARTPYVLGAARRARAHTTGDAEVMLSALDAYRSSSRIIELTAALEEAGSMLAGYGQIDRSIPLLEEAGDLGERLGLTAVAIRVRAQLRALGIRPRTRRRRPAEGWQSLTDSEQEVVSLVAEGLTNRQIAERLYVSPRTVETHLGHVYEKLGLRSRIELATQVASRAW